MIVLHADSIAFPVELDEKKSKWVISWQTLNLCKQLFA